MSSGRLFHTLVILLLKENFLSSLHVIDEGESVPLRYSKKRIRRRKRVADSCTTEMRTIEQVLYPTDTKPTPKRPTAGVIDTHPVTQPVVIAQPDDMTPRPGSSSSGDDVIGERRGSRTPREGTTVRRLEGMLPDCHEGSRGVRPGSVQIRLRIIDNTVESVWPRLSTRFAAISPKIYFATTSVDLHLITA